MKTRDSHYRISHPEKPLLGFGWMGWVLLAIAGALAVFVLRENPDHRLLHVVNTTFGSDAEKWFERAFLGSHRLNSAPPYGPLPFFDLWGLSMVLLAFQIHPRRINPWWIITIILLAILTPIVRTQIEFNPTFLKLSNSWKWGNTATYSFLIFSTVLLATLTLATRSKSVLIGMTAVFITYLIAFEFSNIRSFLFVALRGSERTTGVSLMCWSWNPLLLAIVLSWAIPARVRYNRWWLCFECGYNMRNLGVKTCPECGTCNSRMPSPATPSSP